MAGKHEIIYCGGQFHFDYLRPDFMEKAAADYRSVLLGSTDALLRGSGAATVGEGLSYIGPYYFETDGMLDRDIVETEMRMIENCTHAFFLLEDAQCPGTVSEMVYAAALGKKITVVYVRNEEETESSLRTACWYPIIHCGLIGGSGVSAVPCRDYTQAKQAILERIRSLSPSAPADCGNSGSAAASSTGSNPPDTPAQRR